MGKFRKEESKALLDSRNMRKNSTESRIPKEYNEELSFPCEMVHVLDQKKRNRLASKYIHSKK